MTACRARRTGRPSRRHAVVAVVVALLAVPACTSARSTSDLAVPAASTEPGTLPSPTTAGASGPAAPSTTVRSAGLADPALTPGAVDSKVTEANIATTVCVRGYTTTVRPSAAYTEQLKRAQMTAYHRSGRIGLYEEDHLVALEIGGSPTDPKNLWPEPRAGAPEADAGSTAEDKDLVENAAHSAVCTHRMSLAHAQVAMAADWTALGVELGVRP